MKKDDTIFIAGTNNIIGASLINYCRMNSFTNVLSESTAGLDLLNQPSVRAFFQQESPDYVFLTHVKTGGIAANMKYPAEFIYTNLQIQNNVIHYAYESGVKKLLFYATSCIYPKVCPQPIKEEYLLTGALEITNEAHATAKIAGLKMCQSYNQQYQTHYITIVPGTVFGPHDHFDLEHSHVISALIKKFHDGKTNHDPHVVVWGTGTPRREFIYEDDLIDASLFILDHYHDTPDLINVGYGSDLSIQELAELIKDIVGFQGDIVFDPSKPDGALKKVVDNSKLRKLGWKANVSLREGIERTYQWYKEHSKE